jgi:hypothetical protein
MVNPLLTTVMTLPSILRKSSPQAEVTEVIGAIPGVDVTVVHILHIARFSQLIKQISDKQINSNFFMILYFITYSNPAFFSCAIFIFNLALFLK